MYWSKLFLLLIIWVATFSLAAQHPVAFQLDEKDGLPNSEIYDMIHTPDGFLWLGTDRGLFRYDGKRFKHYPIQSASPAKTHFTLDAAGRIWCMNFSNQLFYLENDSLKKFTPLQTQSVSRLKNFTFDKKKEEIWLTTSSGLFKYSFASNQWSIYHADKNFHSVVVTDYSVFTSTSAYLYYYEASLDSFIQQKKTSPQTASSLSFINNSLFGTIQQFIPAPNTSGIYVLEGKEYTQLPLPNIAELQNSQNMFWIQDANKNYWLLTNNGALGYTADLKKPLLNGKRLLPGKIITELLVDKEGTYWVSTLQNGLYQIPSFEVLLFNEENSLLLDNRLTAIATYAPDQLLLADKTGHLTFWNTQTHKTKYSKTTKSPQNIYCLWAKKASSKFYFSYGYLDNQKVIENDFFAIKTACLYDNHLIIGNNRIALITNLDSSMGKFPSRYQYGKGLFKRLPNQKIHHNIIREQRTRVVYAERSQKRFWVGYADGLYCYTPENKGFSIIKNSNDQTSIIATDIKQSADGILWVSTTENGVLGLQDTTVVFHYSLANGLSSNSCTKLLIDEDNKIWVLSDKGINKIDYTTNHIELFDKKDGLHNYSLQNFIFHQDKVYVITARGLISFPKDIAFRNQVPPSIFLDKIQVNNRDTSIAKHYRLAYNQNNIKIFFTALAYRSQGDFQFKYRMLGIDTSWQYTTANMVSFPALGDGQYTFEAKALNEDKVESAEYIRIQVTIYAPFWKTFWFNGLVFLVLGTIIWQIYKYRLKTIAKQHKLEQDRNKLALEKSQVEQQFRGSQLAALKAQMNPHFIFNALNSIQEYILLNEKRLANEYLGKFADLMRLTLNMSNQQTVILEDELKALRLYLALEAVRFEDTFVYEIDLDAELTHSHIRLPSMLIQPYVENAIKHGLLHKGTERKLTLNFRLNTSEELLICTIRDNGIGRKASQLINKNKPNKHKSFAMSANQKRLELLNYGRLKAIALVINDLYDSAGKAIGTEVILNIPIEVI